MDDTETTLRRDLRRAGLSPRVITAAWPEWWSNEAEASLSARSELRYTLARRLGISPQSLFDGNPKFIWREEARFKNLGTTTEDEQAILTSFGISVGRIVRRGAPNPDEEFTGDPAAIRAKILSGRNFVELRGLLAACWSYGIPVIKAEVFPLPQKRMHAMTVTASGRFAVLIGQDSRHPARTAFTLAHELGHIARGHVSESPALLEMADPLELDTHDDEEKEADRFALELLTGDPDFNVVPSMSEFNSASVADAVIKEGKRRRISPGMIALSLGHSTRNWQAVYGALNQLPGEHLERSVGYLINRLAVTQLDWRALSDDQESYLKTILGIV